MTKAPERLREIARSLNRRQWRPTPAEVELGSTFFHRVKELEEEPHPEFPRGADHWSRLHTENLVVLARTVTMARDELLSVWKDRLPGSPMVELVEQYVSGAEPLLPHAERLVAAWHGVTFPEPIADEIAYEAKRLNVSAEEGEANLRYWKAVRWEEKHHPESLWDDLRPAWSYLGAVRSTMMAAVTGDTDY
ncbi:hypothetical protein ACIRQP_40065 [Streptomyces sp. NPDC102274]|uniref:hypothetical protein n=1 Tax=Streptomyces sp. NPDC102274 TaxID=3366151 RepID=UPI0037FDDAAF